MDSKDDDFDKILHSIGLICALWARIDVYVGRVLHQYSVGAEPISMQQDMATLMIIEHMDIREKATTAVALSYGYRESGLFERTRKIMNTIGNDLRNTRNRLIHDHWVERSGKFYQTQNKMTVQRVPASGEWRAQYRKEIEHSDAALVLGHVKDFEDALTELNDLWKAVRDERVRIQELIWASDEAEGSN